MKRCFDLGRELTDGIGPPVKSSGDKPALPPVSRDVAGAGDGSWEAFVGKMACKGELLSLDREEQIVVKQQMLDRLMLLERELQERTVVRFIQHSLVICLCHVKPYHVNYKCNLQKY